MPCQTDPPKHYNHSSSPDQKPTTIKEICTEYNNNRCSPGLVCRDGRRHICSDCYGNHQKCGRRPPLGVEVQKADRQQNRRPNDDQPPESNSKKPRVSHSGAYNDFVLDPEDDDSQARSDRHATISGIFPPTKATANHQLAEATTSVGIGHMIRDMIAFTEGPATGPRVTPPTSNQVTRGDQIAEAGSRSVQPDPSP
ncbi:hypothetical protein CERZMDRAFT_100025 [Cercospora zeae-maydis SCOH1-5]|uniref:Uncharacterized protein n=1 Tax=Cercospora zeae-maydis SCOH1-5 TaxID=717836 RepID=A0A6A6F9A1_9PEZI|nr:hypothetical protein CERZMDRAFT_100025 [Cercospora zeae-maydis SCOH1-5]